MGGECRGGMKYGKVEETVGGTLGKNVEETITYNEKGEIQTQLQTLWSYLEKYPTQFWQILLTVHSKW